MKSLTNRRFWEAYRKLPETVRGEARKTYRLWIRNPRLPSRHFKKVGKVWSIRIGNTSYRALENLRGRELIATTSNHPTAVPLHRVIRHWRC
jgi:hypothetical protein